MKRTNCHELTDVQTASIGNLRFIKINKQAQIFFYLNASPEKKFEIKRFVINHPREILYERINKRVDLMINAGLLEEVRAVIDYKNLTPLKTVGYSELFSYLNNEISFERALELIKQNTRRYAKRQLTWFRRHSESIWLTETETAKMKDEIISYIALGIPFTPQPPITYVYPII